MLGRFVIHKLVESLLVHALPSDVLAFFAHCLIDEPSLEFRKFLQIFVEADFERFGSEDECFVGSELRREEGKAIEQELKVQHE